LPFQKDPDGDRSELAPAQIRGCRQSFPGIPSVDQSGGCVTRSDPTFSLLGLNPMCPLMWRYLR
jgi:hypothetical protein